MSTPRSRITYLGFILIFGVFVYFAFLSKLRMELLIDSTTSPSYVLLKDHLRSTANTTTSSELRINPVNISSVLLPSILPTSINADKCQPKTKIGFCKTHKTASSTIQNILLRYGFQHNLDFVLLDGGNHLGPPTHQYSLVELFEASWVRKTPWHEPVMRKKGSYDIFALHTHWNQPEVEKLVTKEASFITILRDPVDAFESLFTYANLQSQLYKLPLKELIPRLNNNSMLRNARMNGFMGLNHQLYDLGLTKAEVTDVKAVERKIEELEQEFDLVLITDLFDESMVLMAEELCWPWEAVTSFKVNARMESAKLKLSESLRDELRKWLWADQMAYDHFKQRLLDRINEYGKDKMAESLRQLHEANDALKAKCLINEGLDKKHLKGAYKPWSEQVYGYKVNEGERECRLVAMSENQFVDMVRDYQKRRWRKNLWG